MEMARAGADTDGMNKSQRDDLRELACELAEERFEGATEDHVTAVFERLLYGRQRGEPAHLAVTVH